MFDLAGILNVLMTFLQLYWGHYGLSVVNGSCALWMLWSHVRHERRMAELDRRFLEEMSKLPPEALPPEIRKRLEKNHGTRPR